jgi:hypothetical protein
MVIQYTYRTIFFFGMNILMGHQVGSLCDDLPQTGRHYGFCQMDYRYTERNFNFTYPLSVL